MKIRRLSWAGIEITHGGRRLLIDPLENIEDLSDFLGSPRWPAIHVPVADGMHTDAALTHLHRDHYDPATLRRVLGQTGVVYCPEKVVGIVRSAGLRAEAIVTWQTVQLGDLQLTAVPAVDWRGDEQVSWVVGDGVLKIFHGGDTIWHGSWWRIAEIFAPFKFAVLPVNGVIAQYPGLAPSNLPATLTPEQAVTAARILGAAALCPTHYGQFHNPPKYCEQADVEASLRHHGELQRVPIHFVKDGDWFQVSE